MTDYQPIDYRLRCHTKRTDLPSDVLRDIGEAYAEIGRLREERDEARREVCQFRSTSYPHDTKEVYEIADSRGWDCFEENTNE